ncbi:MAG: dockerin type I domain-containing protein [Planctomycetota bacterium]
MQTNLGWFDGFVETYGPIDGVSAFSTGTFSCNQGDADLPWNGFTGDHPVLVQNLYMQESGRFFQIGMSWAKHVNFVVAQQPSCGTCESLLQGTPYLGPGCMDPYNAAVNADQTRLGPRAEINPWTGAFPFPFASLNQTGDPIFKRLQVRDEYFDADTYPDARYFIEGHMVAETEPGANSANNATYREVAVLQSGPAGVQLQCVGEIFVGEPAINAWPADDPGVTLDTVKVPATGGDGWINIASRAHDNNDGTWRYEVAVHNLNSHRAVRAVEIELTASARSGLTGLGFRDVDRHSGDPVSDEDWSVLLDAGAVRWETDTIQQDPSANAIRWGTLFNFWFTSAQPPEQRELSLELFRPDAAHSATITALATLPMRSAASCPGDVNGDGSTTIADITFAVSNLGAGTPGASGTPGDANSDGRTDTADITFVVSNLGCAP